MKTVVIVGAVIFFLIVTTILIWGILTDWKFINQNPPETAAAASGSSSSESSPPSSIIDPKTTAQTVAANTQKLEKQRLCFTHTPNGDRGYFELVDENKNCPHPGDGWGAVSSITVFKKGGPDLKEYCVAQGADRDGIYSQIQAVSAQSCSILGWTKKGTFFAYEKAKPNANNKYCIGKSPNDARHKIEKNDTCSGNGWVQTESFWTE